jgi:hypothetical protein
MRLPRTSCITFVNTSRPESLLLFLQRASDSGNQGPRQPSNATRYSIKDTVLGAFTVFFMQCPCQLLTAPKFLNLELLIFFVFLPNTDFLAILYQVFTILKVIYCTKSALLPRKSGLFKVCVNQ